MGFRLLLAILALICASASCTDPDEAGAPDAGCDSRACVAGCVAAGYSTGACEGGICVCREYDAGPPPALDASIDPDPNPNPSGTESYLWVANTGEGTLSKVDTILATEVARYLTGPGGSGNDPSRTSVNLHGDVVVTNRNLNGVPGGASSTVKFAANTNDCIDRNLNGTIETSTGPNDVLPWGEDECQLWSTPIGPPYGARATVWDGEEDPESGLGGHVWIGTCTWGMGANYIYKLDGATGEVLAQATLPVACAYGGAIDGVGGLWIIDNFMPDAVVRVDMGTLESAPHPVGTCGYGISVDSLGRVWTGGDVCINRYDPIAGVDQMTSVASVCPGCTMLRGIAVGAERSGGYVWAADSSGNLVKVDQETLDVVGAVPIGTPDMIGVAIDFEGYVWAVSQGGNAAYKFNPDDNTLTTVPIGLRPYTYSDMTGVQLRQVTID